MLALRIAASTFLLMKEMSLDVIMIQHAYHNIFEYVVREACPLTRGSS
jgi:hypothetical protein